MFPKIGANLCQSVDKHAKGAKDTKDAKKVTQRRRGRKEKTTDYTD